MSSGEPDFWANLKAGNFYRGHFERKTSSGNTVHIEASYNPVKDESGTVFKVVKFAIDVTEQVRRNEEVRRAAELSFSTAEETAQISNRGMGSLDQSVAISATTLTMVNTAVDLISKLSLQARTSRTSSPPSRGVAEQTNLLALNAAIEAARAGIWGVVSPWWPTKCGNWQGAPAAPPSRSRRGHREREDDPADRRLHEEDRGQRPGEQRADLHRRHHHGRDQPGCRTRRQGGLGALQAPAPAHPPAGSPPRSSCAASRCRAASPRYRVAREMPRAGGGQRLPAVAHQGVQQGLAFRAGGCLVPVPALRRAALPAGPAGAGCRRGRWRRHAQHMPQLAHMPGQR